MQTNSTYPGKVFTTSREFQFPLSTVFDHFTSEDLFASFWGSPGMPLTVAEGNIIPGGVFHYYSELPDGGKMYGILKYGDIVSDESIELISGFSDENQNWLRHPMAATWPLETHTKITFAETENGCNVTFAGHPLNANAEEIALFESAFDGLTQGFGGTFTQLQAALEKY